jgi:AcrR family transcriptional regulator
MSSATTPRRNRPYAPRLPVEQRREQLLDAALDLALARGFSAVTIDGVAKAVGVTRPVVYGLYDDRGALLADLLRREEDRALTQLLPALPPTPAPGDDADPDALLEQGIEAFLTAVRDEPRTWRVILLPPEGAPIELQQRHTTLRREVFRQLRDLVRWGLTLRPTTAHLDADLFAMAVQTLAEGAARQILLDPERWPVERFTTFTRDVMALLGRSR